MSDQSAGDVYARIKRRGDVAATPAGRVTAAVDQSTCPLCKSAMASVTLLGDRRGLYCQGCRVAMPLRRTERAS